MVGRPFVPETITVHLGAPDSDAENVTVSFPEYIKNVASSEIYPTWPENAIRANIYAQISYALNRVYTEWYRSRGYDFDITNSTAYDQSYIRGRDIFENISNIVDDIFNDYIRRQGNVEPLFAAFCDGKNVQCDGLSQWGSVDLANEGFGPYDILTHYYGDDIELVRDAPIQSITETYPRPSLRAGSSGVEVRVLQSELNRISRDYPLIPKIAVVDGVFGSDTENAVKAFQTQFELTPDGVVGKATWYRIKYIYNAVARLAELNSEGLKISEVSKQLERDRIQEGDRGEPVGVLQYYLTFIATYNNSLPPIEVDGVFGSATLSAVTAFQRAYGLEPNGVVDMEVWEKINDVYLGILKDEPPIYITDERIAYPGTPLVPGSSGEAVIVVQERLNYISRFYDSIPSVEVDGVYGSATENAVNAFLTEIGLPARGIVGPYAWNRIEEEYFRLLEGNEKSSGQYPGYVLREE